MARPRTLLLLSGLLCDATIWLEVVERLGSGAAVRIFDFTGFDSIEAMAQHVLTNAPSNFALVGHSMGGRVALEMVRRSPSRVDALALMNTGVHPRRDAEVESRGRLVTLAQEKGMHALAMEWLPPMMGASATRVAQVMPQLIQMVEKMNPTSFARQTNALLNRPDATPILSSIGVPVLLASGTNDRWSPLEQHRDMQRHIPGATLTEIGDAGHMAPVEQPEAVAAALRAWLSVS